MIQGMLTPSLRGLASDENLRKCALVEIRRDGTVVFAYKIKRQLDSKIPVWMLYELWYSGLHICKDLEDNFGVSSVAIARAGLIRCTGMQVSMPEWSFPDEDLCVRDDDVLLDRIMLAETWLPNDTFTIWATQLANYLGRQVPIPWPPWVVPKVPGGT